MWNEFKEEVEEKLDHLGWKFKLSGGEPVFLSITEDTDDEVDVAIWKDNIIIEDEAFEVTELGSIRGLTEETCQSMLRYVDSQEYLGEIILINKNFYRYACAMLTTK